MRVSTHQYFVLFSNTGDSGYRAHDGAPPEAEARPAGSLKLCRKQLLNCARARAVSNAFAFFSTPKAHSTAESLSVVTGLA